MSDHVSLKSALGRGCADPWGECDVGTGVSRAGPWGESEGQHWGGPC